MEVGIAGSQLPVTQHPPGRAGRMVGARCRAAGRAEAALPGDPRWTAHPPMSPELPSWPRTKHRATCTLRKEGGTLTILPGLTLPRALGKVMAGPQILASLPVLAGKGVTTQPLQASQRACGPAHMLPFPATFPTLGPLSDNLRRPHPLQHHVCPKETGTALEAATVLPSVFPSRAPRQGLQEYRLSLQGLR